MFRGQCWCAEQPHGRNHQCSVRRESVIVCAAVALTPASRRRRPHLYLSEGGEEPGSALQIHRAQGVRLSVHHVGLSGGEGRSVHVSGGAGGDALLLMLPFKKKINAFFPLYPVRLDGIMRRK